MNVDLLQLCYLWPRRNVDTVSKFARSAYFFYFKICLEKEKSIIKQVFSWVQIIKYWGLQSLVNINLAIIQKGGKRARLPFLCWEYTVIDVDSLQNLLFCFVFLFGRHHVGTDKSYVSISSLFLLERMFKEQGPLGVQYSKTSFHSGSSR